MVPTLLVRLCFGAGWVNVLVTGVCLLHIGGEPFNNYREVRRTEKSRSNYQQNQRRFCDSACQLNPERGQYVSPQVSY